MDPMKEHIQIGRRSYRKFVPYGMMATDDAPRCISCGQIDEPDWHDAGLCPGLGGKLPISPKAQAFIEANAKSPVVFGSGREGGGGYYRLKDGTRFRVSLYDCRSMPAPHWDIEESA